MTTKHTPGPWEWDTSPVDYDPEQEAPWLVSTETAKFPDCAVLTGQIKCYREEDARLIAAAPELLEALIDLSRDEFLDDDDPRLGLSRDKARAAIAKATKGDDLDDAIDAAGGKFTV